MGDYQGRHALIFAAAPTSDYTYVRALLDTLDTPLIVCADGGHKHARALGLTPDLLLGDGDSGGVAQAGELVRLPCEKEDTDTQACVRVIAQRGCKHASLVCATGGRLDHMLANLLLLEQAHALGMTLTVYDAQNMVCLHPGGRVQFGVPARYRYFSLVPLDAVLYDVTIEGAKYPLHGAQVRREAMVTISNQAAAPSVTITIGRGRALLICSCD